MYVCNEKIPLKKKKANKNQALACIASDEPWKSNCVSRAAFAEEFLIKNDKN